MDNQFASTCDFGASVPEVGVLPADTSVDFVHANAVLHLERFTLLVVDPAIKVLDDTEAIASQSEVICGGTGAAFAEIVG